MFVAASGCGHQLVAPLPDEAEEQELFFLQGQPQDHLSGTGYDPTRYLDQLPAVSLPNRGDGMLPPRRRTGEALEADEQPVRQAHGSL